MKQKLLVFLYSVPVLGLFLYSFTQIDLSLTFSRIESLRNIVSSFQYIGYFNRPLSTYIYISILIILFGFYFYFLKQAMIKSLNKRVAWNLIILSVLILTFSYNAFSYDIFNYIFDAKIFTFYHQNPYLHKALDFPGDPMLSFMRWTHRAYPYGPFWLILTIPLSYMGFNFFLPTFFIFKSIMAASYIGSIYLMGKIFQKIKPDKEIFGLIFFGLNPLIIVESLVSGHLDIVMVFFALASFYKLINKKYLLAFIFLSLSIGIKFSTIFLLPAFILALFLGKKEKQAKWEIVLNLAIIFSALTVFAASLYSGNFQPWYLVLPLSFAVFISWRFYVLVPSLVISFFALLHYVPYLYLGNWDPPVPYTLFMLQLISIASSVVVLIVIFCKKKIYLNL